MKREQQWYAASVILYVRAKKGHQRSFPVWENVYLIRAVSPEEARARAEARGQADATPDDSMRWNGKPSEFVFGGVRKVVECSPDPALPGDTAVRRIRSGVEATFSSFLVKNKRDLDALIAGKPVTVVYEE